MEELKNDLPEQVEVVDIQFRPGQKVYFFDPDGMELQAGDGVIMDTARGAEFGTVAAATIRSLPRTWWLLCGRSCGRPPLRT